MGRLRGVEIVLLRLRDADGVEGWAYLWCWTPAQAAVLLESLRWLAPGVLRKPPDPAATALALRREINFLGLKGVGVFGLSAYDLALHDLILRRSNTTLAASVGAERTSVPTYWSGFMSGAPLPHLLREADEAARRGFSAIKFRLGATTLDEDERRLSAVLDHLPPDAVVMFDVNQRWDVDTTIAASRRFARFGPRWLEDPLVHNDYDGLARVLAAAKVPIATGENEYLSDGFRQLLDMGVPYLLADLQRVGGVTEWRLLARMAASSGAVLTSHCYPHLSVPLCAALDQTEVWVEYVTWFDRLFVDALRVEDGCLQVPDRPGIGCDLDLSFVERQARGPWLELVEAR